MGSPKPDPLRIAVLEYELLYIAPKPGTAAAAAVNLAIFAGQIEAHKACGKCGRFFRPDEEWCPVCTVCPQHGNLCTRPIPSDGYDCPTALAYFARQTPERRIVPDEESHT